MKSSHYEASDYEIFSILQHVSLRSRYPSNAFLASAFNLCAALGRCSSYQVTYGNNYKLKLQLCVSWINVQVSSLESSAFYQQSWFFCFVRFSQSTTNVLS